MIERAIKTKYGEMSIKVDDCDASFLEGQTWCAHKTRNTFYARRCIKAKRVRTAFYLHRMIMGAADGMHVDHINGDGLDNRRSNLRVGTHAQNLRNQKLKTSNTSGFKGVLRKNDNPRRTKPFEAYITYNGKKHSAGHFATAIEAAHAYNNKASELFGEFARPNVI